MSGPTTDSAETLAEAIDAEWTRPEHACGGDEAACPQTCPVSACVLMGLGELRDAAVVALIASDWMKRHDAEVRAEALRPVRELAFSEGAQAVIFGVTGIHSESYGGVTKDEALECAGELLTNLRAALAEEGDRG